MLSPGDTLEQAARQRLENSVADFIAGGAGEEVTLRANEKAWAKYTLWPRVMTDVHDADPGVTIFGQHLAAPILVSPMGIHRLVDPAGELASAGAARRAALGYVASAASSISLEDISEVAPDCRWFQVYWLRDREVVADLIRRAQVSGYTGICLTVDAPVGGARLRDRRNGFAVPEGIRFANLGRYGFAPAAHSNSGAVRYIVDEVDPTITWEDLTWLRDRCDLPIILKGVVHPGDASEAERRGVDGIFISNHGGRQLDHAPATAHALARVTLETTNPLPIIVDGGVRSASAVAVAVSLGATAVGVGRPLLWALAAGGETEGARMLGDLRDDFGRILALMGVRSVDELRKNQRVTGLYMP